MRFYKSGEIIYDIGEKSDYFCILQKGEVKIFSMFEVESINKWPVENEVKEWVNKGDYSVQLKKRETEWNIKTQKVLRSLEILSTPQLFGHIDLLHDQRPRTIKAIALVDSIVLIGSSQVFFSFLDDLSIKKIAESIKFKNPYEIGK